jgi:murein DD-endopeptidase MepM/ murein hydrolase activator NlpD
MKNNALSLAIFLALFEFMVGCSAPASPSGVEIPNKTTIIEAEEAAIVPYPADGFDFPVGPPDAKKYYNAQGFQVNHHLGEDWNGVGGGNTDKGDPVFAIGSGIVSAASDEGTGWGNVLRVVHNIGTMKNPYLIESMYAHLDQMVAKAGDTLRRGQQLGTIGDAHGSYWAHLHLELRWQSGMETMGGYSEDTTGFWAPTPFIKAHRKMKNGK